MDNNQKSNDQPQKEQKDPAILAKIRDLLAKRGAPISTDVNTMSQADSVPENYAKGGPVMDPKDVIGLPGVPDPNVKPMDPRVAAGLPGVPALPGVPSHEEKLAEIKKAMKEGKLKMAEGGDVDPSELPMSADAPQESKLQAILKAMGMAGSNAISSILPGTQSLADKIAPSAATAASVPGVASAINSALGTSLREPPPAQSGAPLPPAAPLPSAPSLMPSPSAPVAPKAAPSAPAPDPLASLGKSDTSIPGLEPKDRMALSNDLNKNQHTFGNYLAEAVAGLGDAVAAKGGVQQNALGSIFGLQTQQRQEALDNFDKARQAAVEHFNMKNQADQALINNLKARGELIVSPQIAKALGHPELANRPTNQAELVLKTDAMRYDFANKMQERKQGALKNAAEEIDKAEAHGGFLGTQKWTTPQARLQAIHAQAIKNDPEAFGYTVSGGK